jgi:hypothetical protein
MISNAEAKENFINAIHSITVGNAVDVCIWL